MVSIAAIIVGIDGWERYTQPLIESIYEHQPDCLMYVVDNASTEPYPIDGADDHLFWTTAIYPTKRLCYSAAINYGKSMIGVEVDWYVLLSNDVLCTGPFAHLLAAQGNVLAGPCLKTNDLATYIEGWCMCVPRLVWDTLGGMDENYRVSSYEDVDLSVSANEKGFPLCPMPELPFVHLDQKQRFGLVPNYWDSEVHNRAYFIEKHLGGRAL